MTTPSIAWRRSALAVTADLHYTSFKGQPTDDNSLLITQATFGDATLDGKVDAFDLNLLAANWQSGAGLTADPASLPSALASLTQNSGLSTQNSTPIPEPTSLALLAYAATLLLTRRRSCKS